MNNRTDQRREDLSRLLPKETSSPQETSALGEQLIALLQPGDVVALIGELGSGKTQLVKGACSSRGIPPESVTSPTFTLIHEYQGDGIPIFHFDAYRVEHPDEFYELGYEDYFYGEGICFIEWPEKVGSLIPDDAFVLKLEHAGKDRRRIELLQQP